MAFTDIYSEIEEQLLLIATKEVADEFPFPLSHRLLAMLGIRITLEKRPLLHRLFPGENRHQVDSVHRCCLWRGRSCRRQD